MAVADSVVFGLLLVCAVVLVALSGRIFFGRRSTYLPPTAPRSAFAVEAASALTFAGGLVIEAVGLRRHHPQLGFVGSLIVLAAIAIGYMSRLSARRAKQ